MKRMVQSIVGRTLTWLLARMCEQPKTEVEMVAEMHALETLFQNPAIHRYLDSREQFLKNMTADAVLEGKVPDSKFMGGRVSEIRELRARLKAAHVYMEKRRRELSERQPRR